MGQAFLQGTAEFPSCLRLFQCFVGALEVEISLILSLNVPVLSQLVYLTAQEEMVAGAGLIAESGVACGAHGILAGCWYNCTF